MREHLLAQRARFAEYVSQCALSPATAQSIAAASSANTLRR
jgi:hypothetical protein